MKLIYSLFVCIILSVQLDAVRGKICQKAIQCRENECCMTKSSMMGGCRSMGCEGCSCMVNNSKAHLGDMYLMACPCLEGLECVPEVILKNPVNEIVEYINSTCQKIQPKTTHEPADSTSQPLPSLVRRLLKIED